MSSSIMLMFIITLLPGLDPNELAFTIIITIPIPMPSTITITITSTITITTAIKLPA